MKPGDLRRHCLAQPGAVEEFPFDAHHSVFKVGGKMFALTALGRRPLKVSVKCEPELATQFRASYQGVDPGWHLNKRHWNTITLGRDVPDRLVRDMVQDSYDLVVEGLPRRERERVRTLAAAASDSAASAAATAISGTTGTR
jgi:predicted DNA-binding protein (MmcQ/YjbR family)